MKKMIGLLKQMPMMSRYSKSKKKKNSPNIAIEFLIK